MSLVTSCPACGTAFHVKPEQLAPSRGDVRCGKCGHAFNALQYLGETEPPSSEAVAPVAPLPPELVSDAAAASAPTETPEAAALADEATAAPSMPEPKPEPEPEPERKFVSRPPEFKPTPVRAPVREVPPWLLIPLALLLFVLAAGQAIYFLRSEIAVRLPQTKPYLIQACALIGCSVELPRNARLLSIDDSDLQEDAAHKNVLILTATLVNRADYPQAYPLLELTLTDIHDKPVLRRSLGPHEYMPPGTDLKSGLAAGSDAHVRLTFTADGIAATGYRVYVSYP